MMVHELAFKIFTAFEGPVVFIVASVNTIKQMVDHKHIVFDHVKTNIGDGYSLVNGHFTSPVRGAYAFFVVLTNTPGHSASVDFKRNCQLL